jgi:hypothetical protein
MSEGKTVAPAAPARITMGIIIGWIWTVLATITALAALAAGQFGPGLLVALSAVIACPLTNVLLAKRAKFTLSGWVRVLSILALMIALGAVIPEVKPSTTAADSSSSSATPDATPAAPAAPAIPADLAAFAKANNDAKDAYEAADNDLKKSVIRKQRDDGAMGALTNGNFSNWPGVLETLTTNGDGNAVITVRLDGCICAVMTWNNDVSDAGDGTLVKMGTPLYKKLIAMHQGDHVIVSGHVLRESSMTEEGSVNDPEWITQFNDVSAG